MPSFDFTNEDTNINGSWSSEESDSRDGGLDCQGDARFRTSSITYIFGGGPPHETEKVSVLISKWQDHCRRLREEFEKARIMDMQITKA